MNIRRMELQSSMPQIHQIMNIMRLLTTELFTTDTTDHATTSDTHEEYQREEEPRVFTSEELQERSAQNRKPFATGS